MRNLQIAVIAYNRPRYLWVALESFFAVRGINDVPVTVYIDRDEGLDHNWEQVQSQVLRKYPLKNVVLRDTNLGCLQNVTGALKSEFDSGATDVLYVEEDVILRPDTLEYLNAVAKDSDFYSLYKNSVERANAYCPIGNMVGKETFEPLYEWIRNGEYVGKERFGRGGLVIEANTRSHDQVFYSYIWTHGLMTRYPLKSYSAHFGLMGMNHANPKQADIEFERYMFSGTMESWLPRIIRLLTHHDVIPSDVNKNRFLPAEFEYWDGDAKCQSTL